jgi:hypothetical protein
MLIATMFLGNKQTVYFIYGLFNDADSRSYYMPTAQYTMKSIWYLLQFTFMCQLRG